MPDNKVKLVLRLTQAGRGTSAGQESRQMMSRNSLWALGASGVAISGGVSLSGGCAGGGRHLKGHTITLSDDGWVELVAVDARGQQDLTGDQVFDGIVYGDGLRIAPEYIVTVSDGHTPYRLVGFRLVEGLGSKGTCAPERSGTIEGLVVLDDGLGLPPTGVALIVTAATEEISLAEFGTDEFAAPPSFTHGAEILTLDGGLPVQELQIGEMIVTRDAGAQPLRWIGRFEVSPSCLATMPELRPVRLSAHSLGPQRPARDVLLPPDHRILIRNARAAVLFGEKEVLATASHLINEATITRATDVEHLVYFHLLLDDHHIIYADGLEAESLAPGHDTLAAIPEAARAGLTTLLPDLPEKAPVGPGTYRRHLKYWEAAAMA